MLACLGWTRPRLFAAVLGELAVIGLLAGALGGLLAVPLVAAFGLHASAGRALLAIPIAVAVAIIAGAVPAWLASRADPLASVRPPALAVRRGHHPAGITGLALTNVARTPGRSLLGAASLAVGVAALTMATAITIAFRGTVVGSLLGNAVAVQIRGVDYVAIAATVALGVLAVADVLFLNIRERAGELATIRQFGWQESALARLVITEGALIGIAGSVVGAAAGLAGAAEFTGQLPAGLIITAPGAVVAGVVVTVIAALLPARGLAGREQSLPARMSGGEQQRAAIARALINTPPLLLADEPTGNLDSQNAAEILDLLTRLRADNDMTIIIATHDPQIAARCERLIRLRDGAIVDDIDLADGYPADETIRRVGQLG